MPTRPRLLYILHAYYNRAGTEEHTRSLRAGLKADFEIGVLFPHQGHLHLLLEDGSSKLFKGAALPYPVTPYNNRAIEASLKEALSFYKPDLIHVQHFIYWPLCLLDAVSQLKIPIALSLHDFYSVTPQFTMQGVNDPQLCFSADYSKHVFGADLSEYLAKRRDVIETSLSRIAVKLVPSQSLADTLSRVFPQTFQVVEHGINAFETGAKQPSEHLRFGFLGSLLPQKGWAQLFEAYKLVRREIPQTEMHFYGGSINQNSPDGVSFHGVYEQSDLPKILSRIDVGILPSLFAETYSLVLSEFWQAQVPVAVSDIGALSARVQDGVNGRKFKTGDVSEIAQTLKWFAKESQWKQWSIPKPRLLPDMLTEYTSIYRGMLPA